MDTEEGYERLDRALQEIDRRLAGAAVSSQHSSHAIDTLTERSGRMVFLPGTALKMKSGMTVLSEAAGQIAADYVTVYPPGIPVLVPGEEISAVQKAYIMQCIETGLTVHGLKWISQGEKVPCVEVIRE